MSDKRITTAEAVLAELNGRQGMPERDQAADELTTLLRLDEVSMSVQSATITGQGSSARVTITISNGETLTWETIKDMTRPASLAAEVAAATGACPILKVPQALRAVVLLRALAKHIRTVTDDDIAIDWGISYLQIANVIEVDMNDQGQRWDAFSHLKTEPERYQAGVVLRHLDGSTYVRHGWFYAYAKEREANLGYKALAVRMSSVGWFKRGRQGRIKATRPGFHETIGWNFWVVPAGWRDSQ